MNTDNRSPAADVLEQAISNLRQRPLDQSPPADLLAATVADLQSRQMESKTVVLPEQRRKQPRLNRMLRGLVAAVVLIAVVLGFAVWSNHQVSSAFAQAIENVKNAT
ncbi:MAG TPA: hypothetical protein VGJ15_01590, partial [Pirellulales bacterium]